MQIAHQQHLWSAGMQAATESTTSHAETSDTNDGFLRRPVKIATFAWNVNTPLWHTFNPWSAFCEDPRVINRLAHFKNLRMNLHVQFLINGNPFYYGRAIASYIPLPDADNFSQVEEGNFLQIVPSSQRPHVYLDPCKSEGGELVLPFLYPKTYMDIPASEWTKMGQIVLQSINPLLHANEQGDSVDITVFAFASEVSLNTPTCQVPSTLVPQGADEYGKISYPAHLVANWAGRLANAPVIGAYARATEMVANATAGVAAMFGYSRPGEPAETICTMKQYPGHATTNEKDDSVTLAIDAKREVTIDPRVVGLAPQDEMALVPLAMRESYFGVIPWNTDNVPDEHLCSVRVSPMLGNSTIIGTTRYAMSPMAFVAHPFTYWKGSINVRMQVVCSAYHRGRLRVVWDPDHCNDNCAEMFNTNYSMLLDITESQDITFKIGWGANTDYLPVPDVSQISECLQYANYSTNAYGCNGTLSVYVVNGLTCPGSINTPIEINLFCSAADDFEVAVPDDLRLRSIKVDETVGPPPAPTDGPGSTPAPPAQDDIIVAKREFALGMLYAPGTQYPLGTNFDNRTQAVWVDNSIMAYKVPAFGGGVNTVTSGDLVFEFRNHESQAKDVSVTIGATVASGTLAPNIGATLTLTVPGVTLAAGYQEIDATFESTRNVILNYVTSYYPQSYIRQFVRGNDLLNLITEPAAQVVAIGSYDAVQNNGADPRTLTLQAPSNYAVSTRGFFTSRYGMNVNTIEFAQDGSSGTLQFQNQISAPIAVGDQWELSIGTSTNWECEWVKAVYWYDSSLPAPQGVSITSNKKREYEEAFQRHLDEIIEAELEDMEDFQENIEPFPQDEAPLLEPIPEGNCLRRFQGLSIDQISEEHEVDSFVQEVSDVEFYISPSSSDEEKKIEKADASEPLPQGDDTPEERTDDKDDANAPEHEVEDLTMGPTSDVPGLPQIYFGEQITSWRQLLKRYQSLFTLAGSNTAGRLRFPAISPFKDETIATDFVCSIHLLHYVMPAYICQRGGVKYRFIDRDPACNYIFDRIVYTPLRGYSSANTGFGITETCTFSGGHPQNNSVTNFGSVEVPWYYQYRFMPARSYELDDPDNFVERGFLQVFRYGNLAMTVINVTMAVAEDFSLSGFLSVPYMVPSS